MELDAPHGYPIRSTAAKLNPSYLASGAAFCKYYEIDTTSSQRWNAYVVDDVLCVNIGEPGHNVSGSGQEAADEPEEGLPDE